ncbi:MAG TPA: DHA2 family efflux MFS transporter permease subunit [Candidatus Dormibacteraeota bacterium]|nr:DHA2 family efflux MFS transporter permease subunit [Candidatus Dormibacteraeota bacterium]
MPTRRSPLPTFLVTSLALFMVSLDNLVVTTALPVIRRDLGASLGQLEWIVNAYTLTFAVLLLTGAALGDRFGRRRLFVVGIATFTIGSAMAALSSSGDALVIARAIQGVGAAIVTPLTLTLLSAAVPPERRGLALGAWGGVSGLAIAIGPLVGGAIVQGLDWHWIFWLNVPIGIAVIPLGLAALRESHGPDGRLDLPGLALASGGLFALVYALVHGNGDGWTSTGVLASFAASAVLLPAFLVREATAESPMLPLRFFRSRRFAVANVASFLLSFGLFGSVFLIAQYFQLVQGYSPFDAGLRTLPWTGMPIIVAPIAGALSDRIGSRAPLVVGLGLLATGLFWFAVVATPTVPYLTLVPGFLIAGIGMSLFFAPTANLVLSSVRREEEGLASGANNTIREIGGVFGVAILATVFSAAGSYASPTTFVAGLTPAVLGGGAAVAVGALVALAIPARRSGTIALELPTPPAPGEPALVPERILPA